MNTAIYLLRVVQMGLSLSELDNLDIGMVFDMITENANDHEEYDFLPTQEDFDRF